MDYEWNQTKAAANLAKHGVSFTAAALALEDFNRMDMIDDRCDYGEERLQSLCLALSGAILFVVTTLRSETVCRIISARRATQHEQRQYFEDGALFP